MPDFAGSPQSVIVSRSLFVLLAFPLLGLLAEMARASGMILAGRDDASGRIVRTTIGVTALAVVAFAAQLLAQSAGDKYLLQHVLPWLRAGQLETNLDLALDPLSCGALIVVLGLVGMRALRAPVTAVVAGSAAAGRPSATGVLVVLFGAVLAILSLDFFGILAGLVLALAGLVATSTGRSQAQRGFGSLVLLGGAAALFFWGSGGTFSSDGFASDFRARLASVQVGRAGELRAPTVRGDGLLTVSAYPGSLLFVDDSHTPLQQDGRELHTPFSRVALKAGLHSFRLHPGMGLDDLVIAQQPMGEGRELMLLPVGSSLAPREIADQLVLQDANGDRPLRTQALGRSFSGHGAVLRTASWLAVVFTLVWALGGAFERASPRDAALRVAVGLLGAYVLARLEPLVAPALGAGLTGGAVALAVAVAVLPLARRRLDPELELELESAADAPFAGPPVARAMAASLAPLGALLVPEVAGDAPPSPRARLTDAVYAGVLAVVVLVLLVSGR